MVEPIQAPVFDMENLFPVARREDAIPARMQGRIGNRKRSSREGEEDEVEVGNGIRQHLLFLL